jgi:TniQ
VSNLLPWHPGGLKDEILSSWMLRIAAGNDVSVRSICAWLGNDDQIWTLDSMADSNPLINSIAVAVGVEKGCRAIDGWYPTFCVKRYDRQVNRLNWHRFQGRGSHQFWWRRG